MNNQVKDFPNWSKVVTPERTIYRNSLDRMAWQEIRYIGNLEVNSSEDDEEGGTILFVNN